MFSVLLSIYNREHPAYLRQCLDSLFMQSLLPAEIVLVKDGPLTIELDSIISEYEALHPIFKVVCLEKNQGLGKALNEGLKYCSFELVARMDTDDIAKVKRFEKQIEVFQNNPQIDICSAWIDEFEGDVNHIVATRKLPENHDEIALYAQSRCPINHPVVMFRKSKVISAGGYQHFPLFEDYYLWMRMLKSGAMFYNIQESLLYFRTSSNMYKRRGGWKYAIDELHFQNVLFNMRMISCGRFLLNVMMRFPVRIAPNKIRSWIYMKALRK